MSELGLPSGLDWQPHDAGGTSALLDRSRGLQPRLKVFFCLYSPRVCSALAFYSHVCSENEVTAFGFPAGADRVRCGS